MAPPAMSTMFQTNSLVDEVLAREIKVKAELVLIDEVKTKQKVIMEMNQKLDARNLDIETLEKDIAMVTQTFEEDNKALDAISSDLQHKEDEMHDSIEAIERATGYAFSKIFQRKRKDLAEIAAAEEALAKHKALAERWAAFEKQKVAIDERKSRAIDPIQARLTPLNSSRQHLRMEIQKAVVERQASLETWKVEYKREHIEKAEFDKGVTYGKEMKQFELGPLANVGEKIMGRKLERKKTGTWDKHVIEAGNEAGHRGFVLAAASTYQVFLDPKSRRIDKDSFKLMYGVSPDFVWKNQKCKELIDLLDWYDRTRSFHEFNDSMMAFSKTLFYEKINPMLPQIQALQYASAQAIRDYFQENRALCEELKKEHDKSYAQHLKLLGMSPPA